MFVHTHQLFMYSKRKGEMKEQRNYKSPDVLDTKCGFLIENVHLVSKNRVLKQHIPLLVDSAGTHQLYLYPPFPPVQVSVSLIGCRSNQKLICLTDKPCHLQQASVSSLRGIKMPLNLKLHHNNSLPHHLQVDILVLSLDFLLGLFVSGGTCWSLFSCCFAKGVPDPH